MAHQAGNVGDHALVPHDPHAAAIEQGLAINLVDDQEMLNGRNGGPIVVEPEDRVGPDAANPQRRYYVNAPVYHWHQYVQGGHDQEARAAIQHLGGEAFQFGQMTEQRMNEMQAQVVQIAWLPDTVERLEKAMAELVERPGQATVASVETLRADHQHQLDEEVRARQGVASDVLALQEMVQKLQFEVRQG